jgi:hypothetical protein
VLRLLRDSGYLDDTLRSWGVTQGDRIILMRLPPL